MLANRVRGVTPASTSLRLTYFANRKAQTVSQVLIASAGTAAAATPTLIRFGIYSIAASGNLALIGSTPNDTSLFAATFTEYTKALSVATSLAAETLYAFGYLIVTGVAAPIVSGSSISGAAAQGTGNRPRRVAVLSGQSDLPSSITVGSLALSTVAVYAVLIP